MNFCYAAAPTSPIYLFRTDTNLNMMLAPLVDGVYKLFEKSYTCDGEIVN